MREIYIKRELSLGFRKVEFVVNYNFFNTARSSSMDKGIARRVTELQSRVRFQPSTLPAKAQRQMISSAEEETPQQKVIQRELKVLSNEKKGGCCLVSINRYWLGLHFGNIFSMF